MTDPTLEEFIEYITRNEQMAFTYNDILYSIEPSYEKETGKTFLNVWLSDQILDGKHISPTSLVHLEIPSNEYVPQSSIEKVLNEKWIIGDKSFMEVLDDIVVTEIG